MIFSSIEFFVFFALVLGAFAALRSTRSRRVMLLAASYLFYGWWDWRFCFLILTSTLIDYFIGLALPRASSPGRRRGLLTASVVANLGFLAVFKYTNFFLSSLAPIAERLGVSLPVLNIVLPVGISFYTFQTMSYTIDVYRRRLGSCRDFVDFALFVSFFPQLVAGPIVRGADFLPQLEHDQTITRSNLATGASMFLAGFVKKVLFADTLSRFVDPVFADPGKWSGLTCWLAVIAYAGQIYYDFSGYSQMAIGVGRMLGFELPENFRHPYRSLNITEFWHRWHISLSQWLRDYLYIPLGGNRKGRIRTQVNLIATMLLGGLWHGANWTFVVWGGLHGSALMVHKLWGATVVPRLPEATRRTLWPLAWLTTFVFVLITWVFFRSPDFATAWTMLGRMFSATAGGIAWYSVQSVTVLLLGLGIHVAVVLRDDRDLLPDLRSPMGVAAALLLLLGVLLYAPFGVSPFIYFQF